MVQSRFWRRTCFFHYIRCYQFIAKLSNSQKWKITFSYIGTNSNYNFVIEELALVYTISTNNKVDDVDHDFIKDGEEIQAGEDGWKTDPYNFDTDGDGLWDVIETSSKFGERTNPTMRDTDGDGTDDNQDKRPLFNILVSVKINWIELIKDMDPLASGEGDVFAVIYIETGTEMSYHYSTPAIQLSEDKKHSYNYKYYFELKDSISRFTVVIELWDSDGSTGDDYIGNTTYTWCTLFGSLDNDNADVRNNDGDVNAKIGFTIKTEELSRVNTYLINSSSVVEDGYGDLKYVGDEQFYIIYADVIGETIPEGLQTILVSRGTILNTELNQTFLEGSLDDVPYYLQDFNYSTDDYSSSGSKKLITGVLSGKLNAAEFSSLLVLLTTNATKHKFAKVIDVTDNLLELGLASEIINLIPYREIKNNKTGHMPETISEKLGDAFNALANIVIDAVKFVANGIIAIGNFVVNIVKVVISVGKKVLGAIKKVYKAVKEIVKLLVDIIQIILNTVFKLFKKLLLAGMHKISNLFQDFADNFVRMSEQLYRLYTNNIQNNGFTFDNNDDFVNQAVKLLYAAVFGQVLFTIITLTVAGIAIAEKITIMQTGGVALLLKTIAKGSIRALVTLLIVEFVSLTAYEIFIEPDEKDPEEYTETFIEFVTSPIATEISLLGLDLAGLFFAFNIRRAKERDLKTLQGAEEELKSGLYAITIYIIRTSLLKRAYENADTPFGRVRGAFAMMIADIAALAISISGGGLSLQGTGIGAINRFYVIIEPLIDYIPQISVALNILALVSDVKLFYELFTGGNI